MFTPRLSSLRVSVSASYGVAHSAICINDDDGDDDDDGTLCIFMLARTHTHTCTHSFAHCAFCCFAHLLGVCDAIKYICIYILRTALGGYDATDYFYLAPRRHTIQIGQESWGGTASPNHPLGPIIAQRCCCDGINVVAPILRRTT